MITRRLCLLMALSSFACGAPEVGIDGGAGGSAGAGGGTAVGGGGSVGGGSVGGGSVGGGDAGGMAGGGSIGGGSVGGGSVGGGSVGGGSVGGGSVGGGSVGGGSVGGGSVGGGSVGGGSIGGGSVGGGSVGGGSIGGGSIGGGSVGGGSVGGGSVAGGSVGGGSVGGGAAGGSVDGGLDAGIAPTAFDDRYALLRAGSLTRTELAPDDLLDNDLGDPRPVITSFGAGSLGGAVTDHLPGSTATVAAGSLTVQRDGGLTFIPVTAFSGLFTFEYRAQNVAGSDDALVTLSVNEAPVFTSASSLTLAVASSTGLPFTITTAGFPSASISQTGVLPTGLVFTDNGNGTATLSGTPTVSGSFGLMLSASNVAGTASQTLSVAINAPPTLAGAPPAALFGSVYNHAFTVGGFPTPTLTLTAGTLPAGLSLSGQSIAGTPTAAGAFPGLTVTASNGVGTNATLSFTLTVNRAPSLSGAPPSGTVGTPYSHTFTVGGFPAPTLSVAGTLPPGLALTGNTLSGTPTTGGSFPNLVFSASNGVGTAATLAASITIGAPPNPTTDAYPVTGNVNIAVPVPGVLANDTLNGATLNGLGATAGTSGATAVPGTITTTQGGTVSLAADGSFTYNPPAGFVGADAFFYRLTNGSGSATGTVNLTLTNRIWFVSASAAGGGSGRQTNPFNTLAAGLAAAASGDALFVASGTYSVALPLKAGVRHLGASVSLGAAALGYAPAANSVLPATGTAPVIGGTVTLASTAHLNGFRVTPPAGSVGVTDGAVALGSVTVLNTSVAVSNAVAISLAATSGTLTFSRVDANGGTTGISLNGTSATFSVTGDGTNNGSGGTISGHTAHGVRLVNAANVSLSSMVVSGAIGGGDPETSGCGVKVDTNGAASSTLAVRRSQFSGNAYRAISLHHQSNGTVSFTVQDNTLSNEAASGLNDVDLWFDGGGTLHTFDVSRNTFTGIPGAAGGVLVNSVATPRVQTVKGRFNNNTVTGVLNGFSTGFLNTVSDNLGSTMVVEVNGNLFSRLGTMGVDVNHGTGNAFVHATVRNNTVSSPSLPNYLYGIRLVYSATSTPGVAGVMCANVQGNTIPDFTTASSIRLRALGPQSGLVAQLEGGPTATTAAQFCAFFQARNVGFGQCSISPDPPGPPTPVNGTCLTVP